jgi:hypothetical protein
MLDVSLDSAPTLYHRIKKRKGSVVSLIDNFLKVQRLIFKQNSESTYLPNQSLCLRPTKIIVKITATMTNNHSINFFFYSPGCNVLR